MDITFFSERKRIVILNSTFNIIVLFRSFFWVACPLWRCSKNELWPLCVSRISWFWKEASSTMVHVTQFRKWYRVVQWEILNQVDCWGHYALGVTQHFLKKRSDNNVDSDIENISSLIWNKTPSYQNETEAHSKVFFKAFGLKMLQ